MCALGTCVCAVGTYYVWVCSVGPVRTVRRCVCSLGMYCTCVCVCCRYVLYICVVGTCVCTVSWLLLY